MHLAGPAPQCDEWMAQWLRCPWKVRVGRATLPLGSQGRPAPNVRWVIFKSYPPVMCLNIAFRKGEGMASMSANGNDLNQKIIDGLAGYVTALNDRDAAQFGAMIYKRVARELDPLVRPDDVCKLAFPSFLIRPDLRVECFVAVLGDRLVIAWKAGMFRKSAAPLVISFDSIAGIRRQAGASPGARGATLLVISGAPSATIALPKGQADTVEALIRAAIGPAAS